jgi:predicted metal-dependent hydrolase
MPALTVGQTAIPYEVRYSSRATRKRIVVTTEGVRVVAPAGTPWKGRSGLLAFVESKRRWIFDSVREVEERHRRLLTQRYASGVKLQYRGRWLMLDVQPAEVPEVEIRCRSKFHVRVPAVLEGLERLESIGGAFDEWLQARAERDLARFARRHEANLGVEARGYRLSDARRRWGSCGRTGIVRVHWRLIQAPAAAMEYVVAHELAHLRHRNHSPAFWRTLAETMPDWGEAKELLERWERADRAAS